MSKSVRAHQRPITIRCDGSETDAQDATPSQPSAEAAASALRRLDEVHEIVLGGGATRIPKIQQVGVRRHIFRLVFARFERACRR